MAPKSDKGKSKDHGKPLRRLSAAKKSAQKSNAKLPKGSTITSFFKNIPPSKLACPLCGHFIPRFKINDHIDSQCRDFLEEKDIQAGAVGDGEQEKPSWPFAKNASPSPGQEKHADTHEDNQEEKTSPYFKKSGTTRQESPKNISHAREGRIISLGRLSSKLSKKVLFASEDTEVHSTKVSVQEEPIVSEPSGSQKENFDENISVKSEEVQKNSTITSQVPPENSTQQTKPKAGSAGASRSAEHTASLRLKKRTKEESPGAATQKKTRFLGKRSAKTVGPKQLSEDDVGTSELKDVERSQITAKDGGRDLPQDASAMTVEQSSPRRPYYLQNFLTVLETVLQDKDDRVLFSEEELSSIQRFKQLSGREYTLVHN